MRVVGMCKIGSLHFGRPIPKIETENVWRDLVGRPAIWHVVERLKKAKTLDEIVIFGEEVNQREYDLVEKLGLNLHLIGNLGNEDNLDKFSKFLEEIKADVIVEIPSQWALVDPETVDLMVEHFISNKLDILERDYGFLYGTTPTLVYSVNVFQKLKEIEKSNFKKGETLKAPWIFIARERPELFKIDVIFTDRVSQVPKLYFGSQDSKGMALVRKIYRKCYKPGEIISLNEILLFYEKDPNWFKFLPESQLEIEVTNDCNLKCIMCPRTSEMSREINYMDFELFKKIVDETDVLSIHFSGLGEPLLHPQIKEMFTYAKEKGLEVGLWTNGIELTEDLSKEILERGFLDYIIFGLDADTKETYTKVKGVDVFDKAIENITRFLRLKKEKVEEIEENKYGWLNIIKPIVGVQILKMKENDAEIEKFMNKWDYMNKIKKMINYRNRFQELSMIKNEGERSLSLQKLYKELYNTFYTKAELPVEHAIIGHFNNCCGQIEDRSVVNVTPLKRFVCKQLQSGVSVLWNGDVVLCRQDFDGKYPLGNLKEQSLDEILESQKLKVIWQAHKDKEYGKLPLCKDCKEWYYNIYA
ncbi:MAG: radical SAM protein [bacterium]|nr:radical SAM protein [bacterium]